MSRTIRKSRQRGAAMVEGVVVLPVFLALFIGVFYVRSNILTRQEVDTLARSCAWRFAAAACDPGRLPAECRDFVQEGRLEGQNSDSVKEQVAALEDAAFSSSSEEDFVGKVVGQLISPEVTSALTRAAHASPSKEIDRPAYFGGGTLTVHGKYQIACNLEETKPLDVAKDAWDLAQGK